jgi:hypothetical protein
MTSKDPTAADLERSSERWLAWLARETARRQQRPESALSTLWDVLEEWFTSDEFASSPLTTAVVAPPDGRGPAAHAALIRHRQAMRRLLEDLARTAGATDPTALAVQLLTLIEPRAHSNRPGGRRRSRVGALSSPHGGSGVFIWCWSGGPPETVVHNLGVGACVRAGA